MSADFSRAAPISPCRSLLPLQSGVYIESSNTVYLPSDAIHEQSGEEFIPALTSHSGANYFNRDTQFMHLVSVT